MYNLQLDGAIAFIALSIETLTSDNAEEVRQAILPELRTHRIVVLDLGALRYFDAAGFAEILHWAARATGRDVYLCSQSTEIHALFELLRAPAVVPIYRSREEVLATLSHDRLSRVGVEKQGRGLAAMASA